MAMKSASIIPHAHVTFAGGQCRGWPVRAQPGIGMGMLIDSQDMRCEIEPGWGALVRSLRWRAPDGTSVALLHEDAALTHRPEGRYPCGLWPLVPFCNRAWGGRVLMGDSFISVPLNEQENNAALHGFGTQSTWEVEAQRESAVTLRQRKAGGEDPYRYTARLEITLSRSEASFTLSAVNEAAFDMPFGLGLHPWFPRVDDSRVRFSALGELTFRPGGYRAAGNRDWQDGGPFSAGLGLSREAVTAHSVLDWDGSATILSASQRLAIHVTASETARHPVLWCPPDSDFVCLEPQSHAIGATSEPVAAALTPLTRLAPGELFQISMTIRPEALPG
jgi:aldose 1-epimerase